MKYAAAALLGFVSAQQDLVIPIEFNPATMTQEFEKVLQQVTDADGDQVTFSQCDDDTKALTLDASATTYSPDPFGAGDTLTFDYAGSLTSSVTVSVVHVTVKWGAITLSDDDHDLDGGPQTFDTDFDLSIHFTLPAVAPKGSYTAKVVGKDDSGTSVSCVNSSFNL